MSCCCCSRRKRGFRAPTAPAAPEQGIKSCTLIRAVHLAGSRKTQTHTQSQRGSQQQHRSPNQNPERCHRHPPWTALRRKGEAALRGVGLSGVATASTTNRSSLIYLLYPEAYPTRPCPAGSEDLPTTSKRTEAKPEVRAKRSERKIQGGVRQVGPAARSIFARVQRSRYITCPGNMVQWNLIISSACASIRASSIETEMLT